VGDDGGTSDGASTTNGTGGAGAGGSGGAAGRPPGDAASRPAGDAAGEAGASTDGSSGGAGADGGGSFSFQCADPGPSVAAPPAAWANATGNLANMASECGNLGLVSANPCSKMVIAGVAKAGLWGTEDGGKTWSKLGSGAGSAVITNRISAVVYDPAHPGTFWESGIYNGGGVYKTTNNGETFDQLGDVTHNRLGERRLQRPRPEDVARGAPRGDLEALSFDGWR